MNFTTDLPKRNPLVSYIVASAMRCEKFFPESDKNGGPVFRMHAVILKTASSGPRRSTKAAQQQAATQQQVEKGGPQTEPSAANQK